MSQVGEEKTEREEASLLIYETWTLAHSVGSLMEKTLAGASLNSEDFGFYSAIFENQPVTPADIAEVAGMPPTTVSSYLNRVLERGHIVKARNPADGRSFLVELTPPGIDALHDTWLRFLPAQDAVIENLALPEEQVIEALRELTRATQAATPENGAKSLQSPRSGA